MKEDFKKFLCEKAFKYYPFTFIHSGKGFVIPRDITLKILIQAMWVINREGTWKIRSQPYNGNYTKYIVYKVINHTTEQCGHAKEFKQFPKREALAKEFKQFPKREALAKEFKQFPEQEALEAALEYIMNQGEGKSS